MFSPITISVAESRALSPALRLGVRWAHFGWAGRGHAPWGWRSARWPGSRGQGSRRVTPHSTHCARRLEVSPAYAGSRSEPARHVRQLEVTFHWGDPFIWANLFFSACFYPVNSDGDKKNGSQATFWGTDEHIFKEQWKKRNNGRRLGINTKLNLTTCDDAPYK